MGRCERTTTENRGLNRQRGKGAVHFRPFFLEPDAAVIPSLQATSAWATAGGYDPAAVNTFLQVADYYLIAHAHAHEHIVVTHEVVAHTTKRIKIPNACLGMSVRCMTPFEMLRAERARFVNGA